MGNVPTITNTSPSSRHAFSLIEAAIVLAIVGLVMGGIWAAASASSEARKTTELVSGVILGSQNLRAIAMASDSNPDVNGWTRLDDLCANANIFPTFTIENGKLQNPFGSKNALLYGSTAGYGVSCSLFLDSSSRLWVTVGFRVPTTGIAQKVGAAITSKFRNNADLGMLWFVGNDNTIRQRSTWPLSPTGTDTAGLVEPVSVTLFFTLQR